jgi:hypothetical protein
MKTKTLIHLMIFAVLALSACARVIQATPEVEITLKANQAQLEVETEAQSIQDIESICTHNSDQTRLLINFVHGYCLQYPAEYDLAFGNGKQVMFFKNSILNTSEPNFHIDVQPAGGMTIEQAADKILEVYAIPGIEHPRLEITIGGEKAIMLDGLSGQDPNRQVVVIHEDTLYTLYFMQMDKSQPELVAQAEELYNTVIQSFNFRPEANACPDCLPSNDVEVGQTQEDPQTAIISGWVWHDLCDSGQDGEPAKTNTPEGCVEDISALGNYHADGLMSINEPLIEGVVVMLGEGICPSTGMAEYSTIITDLSYSFTSLKAGTYCVSIDPQREPNFSILRPGEWTYPAIEQGVISSTVTLYPGEYRGMVNFGWDYQFQP